MKRWISLVLASALFSMSMIAFASEPVTSDEFVEAGKVYYEYPEVYLNYISKEE